MWYAILFAIYVGLSVHYGEYAWAAYGFTLAVVSQLFQIKCLLRKDED